MRHIILAALLSLPHAGYAATPVGNLSCSTLAELAEFVMEARQSGVDVVDMVGATPHDSLARDVVLEAYSHPRFTLREHQLTIIQRYREAWYIACIDGGHGQ